ncbi:hypothetical protein [Pseudomonas sp.]|uniref:hypothetical protein n=1 Tax=Pseudomonas sp. TaxID=306 RepID=UPI003C708C4B
MYRKIWRKRRVSNHPLTRPLRANRHLELARQRRLEALATLLAELDIAQAKLERQCETLAAERSQADRERKSVPSERPLHDAIAAALQAARDVDRTRQLLVLAETRGQEANDAWQSAREWQRAWPDQCQQQQREGEARRVLEQAE